MRHVLILAACSAVAAAPAWRPAAERGDKAANRQFLVDNAEDPDVVSLPSGLQYKVITSGHADGKSPGRGDRCVCHGA